MIIRLKLCEFIKKYELKLMELSQMMSLLPDPPRWRHLSPKPPIYQDDFRQNCIFYGKIGKITKWGFNYDTNTNQTVVRWI